MGNFKFFGVGPLPASAVADGRHLHDKLLYFDLVTDMPGRGSKPRVSVLRCRHCRRPDHIQDIPKHRPVDLTKYVLNSFSTKFPQSTSPSTIFLHRRNSSRSTKSRDINRSQLERCSCGHVRSPLGRTPQPLRGTRTRSTTAPTTHPPLLVGHPFTSSPVQPFIPKGCASELITADYCASVAKYYPLPGIALSRTPSGFNAAALQPRSPGYTSDTTLVSGC